VNGRLKVRSEDQLNQLQEINLGLERQVQRLRRGERAASKAGKPMSVKLQRLLVAFDEATELDLNETPLRDAFARLAARHGITTRLDEDTLIDDGVQLEQPLTLRRIGFTLRAAIESLLKALHLGALIRDDELVVTTTSKARELIELDAVELSSMPLLWRIQAGIKRSPRRFRWSRRTRTSCSSTRSSWAHVAARPNAASCCDGLPTATGSRGLLPLNNEHGKHWRRRDPGIEPAESKAGTAHGWPTRWGMM